MIGQTISHYRIVEELGRGGMGVVYKAQDLKLDRTVALKFLPPKVAADAETRTRFLQEAKAAAALNHSNICTIYGVEESAGTMFIAMEYIEGGTLRTRLPFAKVDDALTMAIQIGEALQEAHARGIVHRDIKADNIMVTSRGQAKVMDFGLAKVKGMLRLTRASSAMGTIGYMAPEQLQGGEADHRSDIFSFGVLLFEMLTGKFPFRGEHEAAITYSVVNEEPQLLTAYLPDAPSGLTHILRRALEKDPEDRYQSIADMVSELRREQKRSTRLEQTPEIEMPMPRGSPTDGSRRKPMEFSKKKVILVGAVGGIVLALAIAISVLSGHRQTIDSLAVMPFENVGGDPNTEYLSDGITESLMNTLSQLSHLTVMSRSSVFHYKGKGIDPQKAGKELGVKAVLAGRVTQRGDYLQISTELVDVSNNSHLWGEQYNKKFSDILAIQEEISKEISKQLSVKLVGEDESKLSKRPTENTEAYQLYLKGRFHWNKRKADDLQRAVDYFNQAIDLDPKFALAYAGLASTYAVLPEYSGLPEHDLIPKGEAAAMKAMEFDPALAEPHAVLGMIKHAYQWDWQGAERELKRAIELNPKYPTNFHWYSICLRQQGKYKEALPEITRALDLDPLSLIINLNVGEVYCQLGKYDLGIEQLKKTLELDPNFAKAHQSLGMVYVKQGKFDDALRELETVRQIVGEATPYALGDLAYTYARAGKKDEAVRILDMLREYSRQGFTLSVQTAEVYAGLGDRDKAFEWLEKGYSERNSNLPWIKVDYVWDDLRSDPRYTALLKKIGMEK